MSSKEFNNQKFRWYDQVRQDPQLPGNGFKIAYGIGDHFREGEAWPGLDDFADENALAKHTVIEMVRRLVERGHLEIRGGPRSLEPVREHLETLESFMI